MANYQSRDDLLWLAGLLEGEGSFTFDTSTPKVGVTVVDEDVIERAASIMDAKVYEYNGTKQPVYRARVYGKRAIQIMNDILPFMGTRRAGQISDVLDLASNRKYGLDGYESHN